MPLLKNSQRAFAHNLSPMYPTALFAQLWGPTLLAVASGVFASRKYYNKIYRDLQKEPFGLLLFGMIAIPGGIAHINYHTVWGTLPEIVITLLGWGLLLKGLVFAIAPGFVDKAGDFEADVKLIPIAGVLMTLMGLYLSWVGFFA